MGTHSTSHFSSSLKPRVLGYPIKCFLLRDVSRALVSYPMGEEWGSSSFSYWMENQDSFIWSSLPNTHRVLTQHGNIIGLTGPLYWTRLEGPALSVARSFKVPFIIKNWMAFLCIVNGCLPSFLFSKQPIFALHFYFLPFILCVCIWGFRGQCQVFSSVTFNIIFLRQMSPQTWSLFWLGWLAGEGHAHPGISLLYSITTMLGLWLQSATHDVLVFLAWA